MTKPALHASMLGTLSNCGMLFKFRYIDGLSSPPGIALVTGKAVDLVGSDNAMHKMAHGEGRTGEEIEDLAATMFEGAWEGEEPALDEDEKAKGRAVVKGETKDVVIALSKLEADEMLPGIQPINVQKKRRLVLDGFPFDVEGTTDLEEVDTIRDRKTAKKTPSDDLANGNVQLGIYTMLRVVGDKQPVKRVVRDTLVKTKTPKYVKVEAPAPTNFDPILRRLEMAAHVITSGAFMPVDSGGPSGWVCQAAFCGFWKSHCEFGARSRVTVSLSPQE
jgi:hypothetical protein